MIKAIKYVFILYCIIEINNIYRQYKKYIIYKPVISSRKTSSEYTDMIIKQIINDKLIINKLIKVYGDKHKITYTDIFNMLYHIIYCKLYKYHIPTLEEYKCIINVINNIKNNTNIIFNKGKNSIQKGVYYGNEHIYFYPTLIPIQILYKLYHWYKHLVLIKDGFKYTELDKNILIYTKPSNRDNIVIFFHGLGFGLIPYISFLNKLTKCGTLISVELPNISKNKTYYPNPTHHEIIKIITQFIKNKYPKKNINIILHSYGTTFMKSILNSDIKLDTIVLIDPMCFYQTAFTSAKYFCSKFLDKIRHVKHQYNGLEIKQLIYHCILHFIVFDIDSQFICKRQLWGIDKWIDDDVVKHKSFKRLLISLAEKEYFYNSSDLLNYLKTTCPSVNIIYNKSANHGDLIFTPDLQNQIVSYLSI